MWLWSNDNDGNDTDDNGKDDNDEEYSNNFNDIFHDNDSNDNNKNKNPNPSLNFKAAFIRNPDYPGEIILTLNLTRIPTTLTPYPPWTIPNLHLTLNLTLTLTQP